MSENNKNKFSNMIDINSVSETYRAIKKPIINYTTGIYKNLGNIIKAIAFVLAIVMIILGFIAAFLLFSRSILSVVTGLATVLIFTVLAAIIFFPIFGLGHVICQNNEILKMLDD